MLHRTRIAALAAPAFWLCLLMAITLALIPHPPAVGAMTDKQQHMLAFGTLALLGGLAFPAFSKVHLAERLSFLGAMVEVLQSMPALHRDCDIRDWIADTFAICLVLVVMHLVYRPRRKRQH